MLKGSDFSLERKGLLSLASAAYFLQRGQEPKRPPACTCDPTPMNATLGSGSLGSEAGEPGCLPSSKALRCHVGPAANLAQLRLKPLLCASTFCFAPKMGGGKGLRFGTEKRLRQMHASSECMQLVHGRDNL